MCSLDGLDEGQHMKFEFLFQHSPVPLSSSSIEGERRISSWISSSSKSSPIPKRHHPHTHRIVRMLLLLEILFSFSSLILTLIFLIFPNSFIDRLSTSSVQNMVLPKISLCIILSVNLLTTLNVCLRIKNGHSCASTLMVHVIWKIILSMVLMPIVALFSFIRFEEYIYSWPSRWLGVRVLIGLWLYAVFSLISIVLLSGLARGMWAKKSRLRRSSVDSKISIIGSMANNELVTLSSTDLFISQ